jgi:hypothetical protein
MVLNYCKESRVRGVEYEDKGAAMVMTQSGDTEAKDQQRVGGEGSAASAITRVTYLYGSHSI